MTSVTLVPLTMKPASQPAIAPRTIYVMMLKVPFLQPPTSGAARHTYSIVDRALQTDSHRARLRVALRYPDHGAWAVSQARGGFGPCALLTTPAYAWRSRRPLRRTRDLVPLNFVSYFTIQSNAIAAAVFLVGAAGRRPADSPWAGPGPWSVDAQPDRDLCRVRAPAGRHGRGRDERVVNTVVHVLSLLAVMAGLGHRPAGAAGLDPRQPPGSPTRCYGSRTRCSGARSPAGTYPSSTPRTAGTGGGAVRGRDLRVRGRRGDDPAARRQRAADAPCRSLQLLVCRPAEDPERRGRPVAQERPTDDRGLSCDGAERPRVRGCLAMIAHHEQLVGPSVQVASSDCGIVGSLAPSSSVYVYRSSPSGAVDGDAAVLADRDGLAGQSDDPLDERRPSSSPSPPAGGGRRCRRGGTGRSGASACRPGRTRPARGPRSIEVWRTWNGWATNDWMTTNVMRVRPRVSTTSMSQRGVASVAVCRGSPTRPWDQWGDAGSTSLDLDCSSTS